jgi:hypothetical protein
MDYYEISREKAEEYLTILNNNEIGILRKRLNKGGVR